MVSLSVIILEFQLLRTPVLLLHHQHFSCFHSKASNKISIAIHASFNPFNHSNPCTSPFSGISDISSQRCLLRDPCGPARAFIENIRRLSLHVILWRIWMFLFSTADWCTLILVLETNQTGRGLMVYVITLKLSCLIKFQLVISPLAAWLRRTTNWTVKNAFLRVFSRL